MIQQRELRQEQTLGDKIRHQIVNLIKFVKKKRMSLFVGILFFHLVSCINHIETYKYSIILDRQISDNTEYKIDSIIIKHSSMPYNNENWISSSNILFYEDENRKFFKSVPSNYIAKELYFNLRNNDKYIVWHNGGELSLLGKFYIMRKDGNKIAFDSIKHEIPFVYYPEN